MIKKMLFLTLALVAFSVPADVVIPLTQDVAAAIGVQKPTDAVKYFYAKCDTLPETGKTIELATNKNTQLSIKEVKSFEVKALEASFAKKQNVAVLFVVPNTENSFVLQITFNATATQPDGKTKQPTWTDVRIYGTTQTCPKAVEAFVKKYFSPSRFWRNVAGTTAGVVGLSFLAFHPHSEVIRLRRPIRKAFGRTYEYDENLDIDQNAKLAFAFHVIGNADTFITIDDIPEGPSMKDATSWVHEDMNNRILILTETYLDDNQDFFKPNKKDIEMRVFLLNGSEDNSYDEDDTVWYDRFGFHEDDADDNSPFIVLGFFDGRTLSEIKKTLTADHAKFMEIWNQYQQHLAEVTVS